MISLFWVILGEVMIVELVLNFYMGLLFLRLIVMICLCLVFKYVWFLMMIVEELM